MNKQKFVTSNSPEHSVTNIRHQEKQSADTTESLPEESKSSGMMTILIIGSGILAFAAVFLFMLTFNPAAKRDKPSTIFSSNESPSSEQIEATATTEDAQENSKRLEYLAQLNERLHGDSSLQARVAEQAAASRTTPAPTPEKKAEAVSVDTSQSSSSTSQTKDTPPTFKPIAQEDLKSSVPKNADTTEEEEGYQAFGRRSALGRSHSSASDVLTLTNQELISAIDRFESNFETLDTKKMNAYDINTTPQSVELYSYLVRNYKQVDINLLEVDTGVASNVRQVKMKISGLIDKKDKDRKASKNWSTIQLTIEKQASNNIYITW